MSFLQEFAERYRQHTLSRIQRRFEKIQQSKQYRKRSRLKQWLTAADQIERINRRVKYGMLSTLFLLPAIWVLQPLFVELGTSPLDTPEKFQKSTLPLATTTKAPSPKISYTVQLQIEPGHPETDQILEKIRQRPLPIEIKPTSTSDKEILLLSDSTPTTRQDAERLQAIYAQLFGVQGEIIEQQVDQNIETDQGGSI